MKTFPDEQTLNSMWSLASNSSNESGLESHLVFARLLYVHIENNKLSTKFYSDSK